MVDLMWVAARLTQIENQRMTTNQQKRAKIMNNIKKVTLKLSFAGVPAEIDIETDILSKQVLIETLDILYALGFEKTVYGRGNQEIKEGVRGTVQEIKKSDKTTKNGKPMFEVICNLEDGSKLTILKLMATEFRKGDEVVTKKNDAGYQDIELYFDAGNDPDF